MSIDNLPDKPEDIVDIIAKTGYLKAENEHISVSLEKHNQINIQPKGTIFGAKVKVEDNGSVTPTLTFDTKKLRDPKKQIDAKSLVDEAIEDFWENQ